MPLEDELDAEVLLHLGAADERDRRADASDQRQRQPGRRLRRRASISPTSRPAPPVPGRSLVLRNVRWSWDSYS